MTESVIPLDAGWNDLGAWSALWDLNKADDAGNVTLGDVFFEDVKKLYPCRVEACFNSRYGWTGGSGNP